MQRLMFSSSNFLGSISVAFGVSKFTVTATVWRLFSENEDKKKYYFYRSCINDCISNCTPLDNIEN
ncbi:hypothetical protein T4B_11003 [Trichinella pseudospiralis]|uniref:Uncharacterized protein n=1 Tax=Trichinella pseudospiralis TaxID=6337 RepID=A0A0V1IED8_TRIPS|nr:hypothetical protein T4A_2087 [Trichinella pseudospiralis]KRZ21145.1 hypothetical protein T4B_11003 [Trichinella pseudospiralis]KRZ35161.1 hypothetical protein T4C_10545 [Trichinella pseudospiralis]